MVRMLSEVRKELQHEVGTPEPDLKKRREVLRRMVTAMGDTDVRAFPEGLFGDDGGQGEIHGADASGSPHVGLDLLKALRSDAIDQIVLLLAKAASSDDP